MRNKILLTFAAIILIVLSASENQTFSQENNQEFVKVTMSVKKYNFSTDAKVQIINKSLNKKEDVFEQSEVFLQSITTVDCIGCDLLTSEYGIFSVASRVNKNSTEILYIAKFRNPQKCNLNTRFFVQPGKTKEINLKCGIKITAYYE